jgi:hypothetical protein
MGGFEPYFVKAEPGVKQPGVIALDERRPAMGEIEVGDCRAEAWLETAPMREDAA